MPIIPRTQLCVANSQSVAKAGAVLRDGGLVAFPTETVYGLGADALSARAVAKIYQAKGRPSFNPLIAHVATLEQAFGYGVFSALAKKIAERFWPGPLTLVVPAVTGGICDLARAGLASVAIRIPASKIARDLIIASDRPLAAPSANRSGHVSPVTAAHVMHDLDGRVEMVLDGGACSLGLESTILSLLDDSPKLLRTGGLVVEHLESELRLKIKIGSDDEGVIIAPGQLTSHYAPQARLRLNAVFLEDAEFGIDFAGKLAESAKVGTRILDLSPNGNLEEAAANLFTVLRALDGQDVKIAVAPIPHHGLGAAINDRMSRAAAGR